jgi:hypothetical protein
MGDSSRERHWVISPVSRMNSSTGAFFYFFIFAPIRDGREPGLTGYHSKEGFINQKKLLDKAVLILKYKQSNDL